MAQVNKTPSVHVGPISPQVPIVQHTAISLLLLLIMRGIFHAEGIQYQALFFKEALIGRKTYKLFS